ncbi:MAG: hypothetical protein KUG77_13585 [Nannocystaceae bacterium]|nr:hypothetical protein [Nannocystaceae bacterium]
MTERKKFRYEYPIMEPHFIAATHVKAVATYIKRTYPHNYDEVLPTLVEIPDWPEFWKVLSDDGRAVPRSQR